MSIKLAESQKDNEGKSSYASVEELEAALKQYIFRPFELFQRNCEQEIHLRREPLPVIVFADGEWRITANAIDRMEQEYDPLWGVYLNPDLALEVEQLKQQRFSSYEVARQFVENHPYFGRWLIKERKSESFLHDYKYCIAAKNEQGKYELLFASIEKLVQAFGFGRIHDNLSHFQDLNTTRYDEYAASIDDSYRIAAEILGKRLQLRDQVLDLGCGTGLVEETLAFHPSGAVFHVVDGAEAMLEKVGSKELPNVRSRHHVDLNSNEPLPFPDRFFQKALSTGALYYLDYIDKLFIEVARVLVPGGVFIFSYEEPVAYDLISINTKSMRRSAYCFNGTRNYYYEPYQIDAYCKNAGFHVQESFRRYAHLDVPNRPTTFTYVVATKAR